MPKKIKDKKASQKRLKSVSCDGCPQTCRLCKYKSFSNWVRHWKKLNPGNRADLDGVRAMRKKAKAKRKIREPNQSPELSLDDEMEQESQHSDFEKIQTGRQPRKSCLKKKRKMYKNPNKVQFEQNEQVIKDDSQDNNIEMGSEKEDKFEKSQDFDPSYNSQSEVFDGVSQIEQEEVKEFSEDKKATVFSIEDLLQKDFDPEKSMSQSLNMQEHQDGSVKESIDESQPVIIPPKRRVGRPPKKQLKNPSKQTKQDFQEKNKEPSTFNFSESAIVCQKRPELVDQVAQTELRQTDSYTQTIIEKPKQPKSTQRTSMQSACLEVMNSVSKMCDIIQAQGSGASILCDLDQKQYYIQTGIDASDYASSVPQNQIQSFVIHSDYKQEYRDKETQTDWNQLIQGYQQTFPVNNHALAQEVQPNFLLQILLNNAKPFDDEQINLKDAKRKSEKCGDWVKSYINLNTLLSNEEELMIYLANFHNLGQLSQTKQKCVPQENWIGITKTNILVLNQKVGKGELLRDVIYQLNPVKIEKALKLVKEQLTDFHLDQTLFQGGVDPNRVLVHLEEQKVVFLDWALSCGKFQFANRLRSVTPYYIGHEKMPNFDDLVSFDLKALLIVINDSIQALKGNNNSPYFKIALQTYAKQQVRCGYFGQGDLGLIRGGNKIDCRNPGEIMKDTYIVALTDIECEMKKFKQF